MQLKRQHAVNTNHILLASMNHVKSYPRRPWLSHPPTFQNPATHEYTHKHTHKHTHTHTQTHSTQNSIPILTPPHSIIPVIQIFITSMKLFKHLIKLGPNNHRPSMDSRYRSHWNWKHPIHGICTRSIHVPPPQSPTPNPTANPTHFILAQNRDRKLHNIKEISVGFDRNYRPRGIALNLIIKTINGLRASFDENY